MTVGQFKRVINNLNDDVELMIVFNDNVSGCIVEDLIHVAPGNVCDLAEDVTGLYLYAEGMEGILND